LKRLLERSLKRGRLERFRISPLNFSFTLFESKLYTSVIIIITKNQINFSDNSQQNGAQNQGACPKGYLQCKSRHCLDIDRWCDGAIDCPDEEDEDPTFCGKIIYIFLLHDYIILKNGKRNGTLMSIKLCI